MLQPSPVRVAVIGVGRMGAQHARELSLGNVPGARLVAVCDPDPLARSRFPSVPNFSEADALFDSGLVDAVLIATPHYEHTPLTIAALARGLHVLTEKPLAVHKADCLRMLRAHEQRPEPRPVFAEMLSYRADSRFIELRHRLQSGELGTLRRVSWFVTDVLRTAAYYRSGAWRATWRGEGGGVLLNQCSHQLDLWQWLFGMPTRVHAFCGFGRFHDIEVEDEVTAYLEYGPGLNGVFVASTAEAPGTNRLEACGDLGRVVLEGQTLTFTRNERSTLEVMAGAEALNARPRTTEDVRQVPGHPNPRLLVLRNFVNAILEGEALIAPAREGAASVELANALIQSGISGRTVALPLDPALYQAELQRLIRGPRT